MKLRIDVNSAIKWVATIFTVVGAVAVTLKIDPLNIILFNIGSALWIIWALRIREYSILVVNIAMMLIYALGAVLRLMP